MRSRVVSGFEDNKRLSIFMWTPCLELVDVVQSIRTGPVESTGRGVAVIGITSRIVSPNHLSHMRFDLVVC